MKGRFIKSQRMLLALGSLALGASLMAMPVPRNQDNQQTAPDNTKKNKDQTSPTADQQKTNPSDRAITQKSEKRFMMIRASPPTHTTSKSSLKTAKLHSEGRCGLKMRKTTCRPKQRQWLDKKT